MSVDHVYLIAEQPIKSLETLCATNEIVLSRRVVCRALAMQIAEELDPSIDLPTHFESMSIPDLLTFMHQHHLLLDLYALKLKLWLVLYRHRDTLHLQNSFDKPSETLVDEDTLDEILQLSCFQDTYGEWMGQSLDQGIVQDQNSATPKVDVIHVSAPDIPVYEEEDLDLAFRENPELAHLVSEVLAAETSPKKRRTLFSILRQK